MLNAAEYFRQASLLDGVAPDPRMTDAIELIRAAKQSDGTWLQAGRHPRTRGSRSMHQPASHRSGSLCSGPAYSPGGKPGLIGQTVAITYEIWPRMLSIYTRAGSEFPGIQRIP